jgi:N6-L-threonylcarbamoyladenine synthase
MKILAIETSADETAAAVVDGRRVLANVVYSQVLIHKKWGGIFPTLAKRAHEEKIGVVISEALKKNPIETIECIAVTQGPGLAISLEVGIEKAKELSKKYNKKLIGVNHLEGHIYSSFVQNSRGNPPRPFNFPYLALIISGGHTELVKFSDHLKYEVMGETIDDAAGEALDKAGKLLGLGYPGGPVIERLAESVKNRDAYNFPRPMMKNPGLDFSFSGLKTSFYYFLKKNPGEAGKINDLASSFQEAVFDTVVKKTERAIRQTGIRRLVVGGGVIANIYLRKKLKALVKKTGGEVLFPPFKYLTGDNAAMIGIVASVKAKKKLFVKNIDSLDRIPRMPL